MWRLLLAVIIFTSLPAAVPATADRDIVYSARYYTPPRSKAHSYWHLYRISPSGRDRLQITSARADDTAPEWSPDGKRILFIRGEEGAETGWLCTAGADGKGLRKLAEVETSLPPECRWLPDGKTIAILPQAWNDSPSLRLVDARTGRIQTRKGVESCTWSPDGRWRYIGTRGAGDYLESVSGGKQVPVQVGLRFPVFVDATTVAGIGGSLAAKKLEVVLVGTDGREKNRKPIAFARYEPDAINGDADGLFAIPGRRDRLIYVEDRHDSTTGINKQFYLLDVRTGQGSEVCLGRFLRMAPDGRRYVTAPGRDLGPYPSRENPGRTVWVAPLRVGLLTAGKPKTISTGTVWVVGADWRKAARK